MDVHAGPVVAPVAEIARRGEQPAHALAVRRMFDRISPTYDRLNRMLSWGIDRRWRKRALSALAVDLPAGPLLDACAGTLDLAAAMEQRFADRTCVATDFAAAMLRRGRAKAGPRTHLALGDAMALPFADGRFAGAVCGFGLRNLDDPRAGLAEWHRVLTPGGVLVVLEFFRPTQLATRAFHAFYGRMLLPFVGGMVSGDKSAYGYLSRSMRGFLSRDEVEAAMRDIGFVAVEGRDLTLGIASIVRGVKA